MEISAAEWKKIKAMTAQAAAGCEKAWVLLDAVMTMILDETEDERHAIALTAVLDLLEENKVLLKKLFEREALEEFFVKDLD